MFNLLFVFSFAMLGATMSAKNETRTLKTWNYRQKIKKDAGFILCAAALIIFAGFRISYNDTDTYTRHFLYNTPTLSEISAFFGSFNLLKNPASTLYAIIMRSIAADKTVYIFPAALFTQYSTLRLLKKFSVQFDFSVYLLFTLGTYCFTLGALKQSIAMGVLTYAIEAAERKKWVKCIALVFIAMLFHTYAIVFIVLPFIHRKPWSAFTWIMLIVAVVVFFNLESVFGSIADAAEDGGKKLYEEEVFGGEGSNIFRILVYAVPPVISFVYRKKLYRDSKPIENIATHLSLLSFICMAYGFTVNANESDRLATYFVIGTIIALPWMVEKAFSSKNGNMVKPIAYAAFFIYFVYKFAFAENFDANYRSILSRYF